MIIIISALIKLSPSSAAPYLVPPRFYAPYNVSSSSVVTHPTMDPSAPNVSLFGSFPVTTPAGERVPWHPRALPLRAEVALEMRRHYHAGISFVDELVGRLLAKLGGYEGGAVAARTVIVFHSDHGYFLGESGEWEKKLLFESAARVPLLLFDPSRPQPRRTTELAELIDLYPSMAALAGLPPPPGIDGVDLSPLFLAGRADADADGRHVPSPLKPAAFSQYPRCPADHSATSISMHVCINSATEDFDFMGYAVRTQDWRYVEWRAWQGNASDWSAAGLVATELYNCTGRVASAAHVFDTAERNLAAAAGTGAFAPQREALHRLLLQRFVHGTL